MTKSKQLYIPYIHTYSMNNNNKILMGLIGMLSISLALNTAYGQTGTLEGIYEDQYVLCNFEGKCFTFNQDDYLGQSQRDEFQLFFNNDMDTYPVEELHD